MSCTKDKLELKKYRGLDAIYLNGKCICKLAFTEYAEHLVRCWNSHDALLEACKNMISGNLDINSLKRLLTEIEEVS